MNNKQTYIGIAIVVFIFGILTIPKIIERIANDDVVRNDRLNMAGVSNGEEDNGDLAYIKINGKDRRVPEFAFINQNGDTITNKDYVGKVYVVEFFFSRCQDICIPMSHNLVEIDKEFMDKDHFGIVSISIDPEHDTPDVLKAYANDYGVTDPNWNFLTGDKEAIYTLANEKFGILAQANPQVTDNFLHSGLFALVDQNGFIRSRRDDFGNPKIYYRGFVPSDAPATDDGESQEIGILKEDIRKLLKK